MLVVSSGGLWDGANRYGNCHAPVAEKGTACDGLQGDVAFGDRMMADGQCGRRRLLANDAIGELNHKQRACTQQQFARAAVTGTRLAWSAPDGVRSKETVSI
jgi:hypothetical protein